jgi:hypothetical protein
VVVTRTGWTLEYIDDASLCRILELFKVWNRGLRGETALTKRHAVSEKDALEDFKAAQAMMPGVSKIPSPLRDAIKWAEEMKSKRKAN